MGVKLDTPKSFDIRPKIDAFPDMFSRMYPDLVRKFSTPQDQKNGINMILNKTVTFIVTHSCNLRCSYCYEHNKNAHSVMNKETAKKAVDLLFSEYDNPDGRYIQPNNAQSIVLDFIGGEPLLEIDLIDWIVDYFKMQAVIKNHPWKIHHWIVISTNGVLYDNPKVSRFIEKNKGRLSITISLDGNKDLHDACRRFPDGSPSYDIVVRNFKKNLEYSGDAMTKMTLSPENIMYLFEAHKHMIELGVINILSNPVYEEGWTKDHGAIMYHELKKLADFVIDNGHYRTVDIGLFDNRIGYHLPSNDDKNWCGGTGNMLAFDYDGTIYPCLRYAPLSLKDGVEPISIGNVTDGIDVLESDKKNVDCLNCITRSTQSSQECMDCPISAGCAWCSAYNYEVTGTPNKRVTYICPMHKARVLANVYYYNKLYRVVGSTVRLPNNVPAEWAIEIIGKEEYDMLNAMTQDD